MRVLRFVLKGLAVLALRLGPYVVCAMVGSVTTLYLANEHANKLRLRLADMEAAWIDAAMRAWDATVTCNAAIEMAYEDCASPDPLELVTYEGYLDYDGAAWVCLDTGECALNDDLEGIMRGVCALGWARASEEWYRWEREAKCLYHELNGELRTMRLHEKLSRYDSSEWAWRCANAGALVEASATN